MGKRLRMVAAPAGAFALAAACFLIVLFALLVPGSTDGHSLGGGPVGTRPPGPWAQRNNQTGPPNTGAVPGPSGSSRQGGGIPVDAGLFQEGSCMLFDPTHGDLHQTVFLDAGHGGIDPGAVGQTEAGRTVYEADLTLPVELDAAALLRAHGFAVAVSRTRDSLVGRLGAQDFAGGLLTPRGVHDDIAARDECADLAKAAVLVGIYFDAGYSPQNAGCLTAYDPARNFWPASLRLAELVQNDVLAALNSRDWAVPDDGVTADLGLGGPAFNYADAAYGHLLLLGPAEPGWFTTPSTMPGALTEPLFVTDPFEASIASSRPGQETVAGGIALAVEQYFGLSNVLPPPRG
jgi:N-acetylmuramoyl-L-alanine amidase